MIRKRIKFDGFDRLTMRFLTKFAHPAVMKEMIATDNFGAGIVNRQNVIDCINENLVAGLILLNSEYKMHPHKNLSGQYFDYGHTRFHLQYEFSMDAVKSEPARVEANVVCNYVEFRLMSRWKNKKGMKNIASMKVNLGEA